MIRREKKVIKFSCDICKRDIKSNIAVKLILKSYEGTPVVVWDLCEEKDCLDKLKQLLGEGRRLQK